MNDDHTTEATVVWVRASKNEEWQVDPGAESWADHDAYVRAARAENPDLQYTTTPLGFVFPPFDAEASAD